MQITKHYKELVGASTAEIQVSAPIYEAEIFFHHAAPRVQLLGISFTITEISSTGLILLVPEGLSISDVQGPQPLAFTCNGTVFFECKVIISSHALNETKLRVVYDEKGIDIHKIAVENAKRLASTNQVRKKPPVTFSVPAEYKLFCTEVLDFLSEKRQFIESSIAPYEKEFSQEDIQTVSKGLEQTSFNAWQALEHKGNELVHPFMREKGTKKDLKNFTEKLITYELVKGVDWNRSFFKPMGYPGDFQIMNYFYDHEAEGDTTYSRYLHMLGLISGRPVVKRMEYISQHLEHLAKDKSNTQQGMAHIMSIGSGPAREIQRFLEKNYNQDDSYSVTLVDQEKQALDYGINAAYRSLAPSTSNVIISGMHTSFTEMLRPNNTFRHLPNQNLIYSAGLVDYLNPNLARNLTRKLYEYLAPGGTLLIGNVNDTSVGMYWSTEFILDWTLYYRDEQEMFDMADKCQGAEIIVERDESGAVYMLQVTKPH